MIANFATHMLWQSAHRGCARIGRQLHPFKAKGPTKDKLIEIEGKNDMEV